MDEDFVLDPEDFGGQPAEEVQEPEVIEEQVTEEPAEDTKPAEESEPVQEPQKIKIKYNSEEKEIPLEEAAALAQKGMNYEKAVERAKQEARDAYIAEQGYEWRGQPIKTEAEYKQALREQQIEQELEQRYADIPDELKNEIIENRRFREQIQSEKEKAAKEQQEQKEFQDFLEAFPDVQSKDIPPEVWERRNSGVPLRYAYMEHQFSTLKNTVQTLKQNETNAKRAPVRSVTAHGGEEIAQDDPFLKGFDSI